MENKPEFHGRALDFEEQIELLRNQGLIINDERRALSILNNVSYDSESLSAKIYSMGMFGSTASHLIANLITDFADKALSVTIVLRLNQLLPDNAKKFFNFYS